MQTFSKVLVASAMVMALATAGAQQGSGGTQSTVKDDLFAGTEVFAKGASDVTEITMDPASLGMVGGRNKARASNMVLNVVRTYEYDKPGMYRIEDVEAFRNKLNTGEWHCSVHTRSLKTGESTDICNKDRKDDMDERAIITVEPKELTFIHTITKRGGSEGELGDMPLMMMHGIPLVTMVDPEAVANMAMLSAKLKTLDGSPLPGAPGAMLLQIPHDSPANKMLGDPSKGGGKSFFLKVVPNQEDQTPPAPIPDPSGKPQ